MAEFCHTFIDSRSFNALSLLIPCPSLSKSFCALPIHSPRILTRRKTSSRNRLTVSAKSTSPTSSSPSPPFDVISTTELSDGSILFRFGDASEVARTGELDTSTSLEKSLTGDKKLNSVKVLDGEQENRVIDKKIESKVTRVDSSNKIDEILPLSANDVTEFGHEREVPASEVIDTDTNGSSGSEDHQGDSASEVVLGLQETEEQGAVVNDLVDLTGAHDVPQLDENGYIVKSGSALLEIFHEGGKGESAPSLNMLSVLNSELASGSAGESSSIINLSDTTKVHQSEDHLADASLKFECEEGIGLSDIIEVAPESKMDGDESVLDQEVRGDMPGELLDTKELLLSQPILVEEVSHEPEVIEVATELKVVGDESVLDHEIRGSMPTKLLDTKEPLLSQPILIEEVSHELEVIEIVPESKMVGAESVLTQEVSGDMLAELLDTKELLSQPILFEEVSHEPEGIEVAPESKVVGAESVLDQEIRGNMPTELLDTKELLLSQPILVEEVSHEPEGIQVVPESKVVGAESVLDHVVVGGMPGELLDTKEPLSQHILVEEVIHEPEGVEGVESAFDQEVSSEIPAELLDTKELLSQPIHVEEVSHEPEGSLETKAYEQSQIYVAAANETDDVQKNGSTRPMDPAEFVKTEETDLVESLGHESFKRETVDTHCSEQINDLMSPAETETEEIPGENKNLVEPSVQTTISREEITRETYVIHCGVSLFPHPKALTGGEDAYFIAGSWFGVADGVSDWSMEGISPGIYARELMEKCANITSNNSGTSPVDVLNRSVNESPSRGLSTILVAHFDGQVLHVANIGDSRIIVIRNNSIYKRSLPMQHEFNFPLLIGNGHNSFKYAEEHTIELDDGDVVITATDGLFDNVYEEEIQSIISKSLQAKSKPQEIAEILASRAHEVGKSVTCRSPFADEATAAGYVRYGGGKLDDVTVIVSMVKTNISHGL